MSIPVLAVLFSILGCVRPSTYEGSGIQRPLYNIFGKLDPTDDEELLDGSGANTDYISRKADVTEYDRDSDLNKFEGSFQSTGEEAYNNIFNILEPDDVRNEQPHLENIDESPGPEVN